MTHKRSLRVAVPVAMLFVVGLAATIIISYQYIAQMSQLDVVNRQNLHDIVIQNQRHMERFITEGEMDHLRNDVLSLALMNDIDIAAVLSPEGDIIFSTQSEMNGELAISAIADFDYGASQLVASRYEPQILSRNDALYAYYPLAFAIGDEAVHNNKVGVLFVKWSLVNDLKTMHSVLFDSIALVLLMGGLVVAIVLVMTRHWVIYPLEKLSRLSRNILRGELDSLQPQSDIKELYTLEASLIGMASEIDRSLLELKNSEERWLFALEASGDGVADWNLVDDKVFYSAHLRALLGFAEKEYIGTYDDWKTLIYEDDRDTARVALSDYFRGDTVLYQAHYRLHCCDGTLKWMSVRGKIVERNERGAPTRLISTFEDITQQKEMEEAIRSSEKKYRDLFELAQEGIWVTDEKAYTLMVNQSMASMLGYSTDEMMGKHVYDFMNEAAIDVYEDRLGINTSGHVVIDLAFVHKTGKAVYVSMHATAMRDERGNFQGNIAGVIDITQRIHAEEMIRKQALYDSLTQLPNRRFLFGRLEEELARSVRHSYYGGLLFIDLDHFKNINDSLGHPVGDKLLLAIGQRVSSVIRDEDVLGRIGGDEFVVLLPELDIDETIAAERARNVAQKIQESFAESFLIEGYNLHVSSSIGVALYPKEKETIHDIFRQADAAMYRSKHEGRNTIRFFTKEIQVAVERKLQIQMLLPQALERKEFYLCYQPQMDRAGRLIGAEALIRWEQPELGLISPDQFIEVAEESGFIVKIGEWVLEEACRQLRIWESQGMPADFHTLAVNISPRQFAMDRFSEQTLAIAKAQGIDPSRIELELTEGMLVTDVDAVTTKMRALRDVGFNIAVDDFGTGYSSLSYLKRFPISKLKIDQSFVRDLMDDRNDRAIIEAIIAITRHLELDLLAEGVETQEHLDFLASKGCFKYQGWHFGRPEKAEDFFKKWLAPESAHYSRLRSQLETHVSKEPNAKKQSGGEFKH
ncbi:MAG: EAL domain-containing protein [Pseudomonadales bacterium]|nr:EAL domain-containing protein [Pseudomonadales bacterium]